MRQLSFMLAVFLMLSLFLAGCGGGGRSSSGSTPPSINGIFDGTYNGSTNDSAGNYGNISLVVSSTGAVTSGSLSDYINGNPAPAVALTGNVSSPGIVTVSGTGIGSPATSYAGTLQSKGAGELAGTITQSGSSLVTITASLSNTASPSQFAGSYSGTSVPQINTGGFNGVISLAINPNGAITGTETPPGSTASVGWNGTITPNGGVHIQISGQPTEIVQGDASLNANGQLVISLSITGEGNDVGFGVNYVLTPPT
jgi:hypothetical protein